MVHFLIGVAKKIDVLKISSLQLKNDALVVFDLLLETRLNKIQIQK